MMVLRRWKRDGRTDRITMDQALSKLRVNGVGVVTLNGIGYEIKGTTDLDKQRALLGGEVLETRHSLIALSEKELSAYQGKLVGT